MRKFAIPMLLIALSLTVFAQGTRVQAPNNRYTVSDDVRLGQKAAAEVHNKMPVIREQSLADNYVEQVGRRLAAAIPPEFRHPEFNYQFDVVDAPELNAFALPGGPTYVNRGMIEAARNEGELAGVMANEIAHVALRHGTAQVTKAQSPGVQLPALGGAILGAIIGGSAGGAISQGAAIGSGLNFLRYSREYESQADILGAQIMASAGYDPRDLANMFRTIEQQGSGSGPSWMSSHPNPGDRYARIDQEASLLGSQSSNRTGNNDAQFRRIQDELRRGSAGNSVSEYDRRRPGPVDDSERSRPGSVDDDRRRESGPRDGRGYPSANRGAYRVEPPSTRVRPYTGSNLFRINVPENWRDFADQNSVTFAPEGAFENYQGQSEPRQRVVTHGAMVGIAETQSRNLRQASDRYINELLQTNSYLQPQGTFIGRRLGGRNALSITLQGRSPLTGRPELVNVYTTLLNNGALFYLITVAPQDRYRDYDTAFQNMISSVDIHGTGWAGRETNRY